MQMTEKKPADASLSDWAMTVLLVDDQPIVADAVRAGCDAICSRFSAKPKRPIAAATAFAAFALCMAAVPRTATRSVDLSNNPAKNPISPANASSSTSAAENAKRSRTSLWLPLGKSLFLLNFSVP